MQESESDTIDIAEKMALLLGDYSHLAPRIRHLDYDTSTCTDRIEVRCSYISFRDGSPTFDDFIKVVSEHTTAFCLPRTELTQASEKMQSDPKASARIWTALANKARGLFIRAKKGSNRSGEAGEIVLYIMNEWMLEAPQIVSKMYLKTNNNMPVHGTDGVHARFDNESGKLLIYWGESKCHKTLTSALSSALTSIKEFVDGSHEHREVEIVSKYMDIDDLGDDAKPAILSYLDPYSEYSNERIAIFSCLLVFEHIGYYDDGLSPEKLEAKFVDQVNYIAENFIDNIRESVKDKGLGERRFEFFLMPVPSVQEFRDKFQSTIGWPDD